MGKRRNRRPQVGKWFFQWRYDKMNLQRFDPWERAITISVVKLLQPVPEAALPQHGKHYKGFVFVFRFRVPFYVDQWR